MTTAKIHAITITRHEGGKLRASVAWTDPIGRRCTTEGSPVNDHMRFLLRRGSDQGVRVRWTESYEPPPHRLRNR